MQNNTATIYNLDGLDIYGVIEMYIVKKFNKSNSEATKKAYKSDILNFFKWRELGFETYEDLQMLTKHDLSLKINDVLTYQNYLNNVLGNTGSTVNRKINTVRELYIFLDNRLDLSKETMKAFREVERVAEHTESYDTVSPEEVMEWSEYVLNKKAPGRRRNLTKSNILKFALQTGFRMGSILNLNVYDFDKKDNEVIVYADRVKGGSSFKGKISIKFYEELLEMHKQEGNSDKLFNITKKSIQDMMDDIKKHFNISDKRNVVFHSIRKAAATFKYDVSGNDLKSVMYYLGHSDISVTERYIGKREQVDTGYITMLENDNKELYKQVPHEELLKALEKLDQTTLIKLNQMLES